MKSLSRVQLWHVLPGFSVHGILQARILEWITISFSRGSSWPRDRTQVSRIGGRRFNLWATSLGHDNRSKRMKNPPDAPALQGTHWALFNQAGTGNVECIRTLETDPRMRRPSWGCTSSGIYMADSPSPERFNSGYSISLLSPSPPPAWTYISRPAKYNVNHGSPLWTWLNISLSS